jgi:tRNA A37 threonylcarbamoyladenosine synthetase subunit TsaC/SUA5/YrdC
MQHTQTVSKQSLSYTQAELDHAYDILDDSGLILIKLDIGYGFVGRTDEAIKRMYELKGRSESNPCVVPGNISILQSICPGIHPVTLEWVCSQIEWTTLSVICDLDERSPLWLSLPDFVRKQSSKNGSVAVFLRPGAFLDALVDRAFHEKKLLAGSSGNQSGHGNSYRPEQIAPSIIEGVDLFINHGTAHYDNPQRMATTMIDLRTLQITRRGVNYEQLEARLAEVRAALKGDGNGK